MPIFFVYEDWWGNEYNHYAVIHLAECVHCNYGIGHRSQDSRDLSDSFLQLLRSLRKEPMASLGKWNGPFPTFQQALDIAIQTGKKVRRCRVCAPPYWL